MSLITKERPKEELKKHLTIDEIMPTWCAYFDLVISKGIGKAICFATDNNLEIAACNRCCVGESWKWSRKYAEVIYYGENDIVARRCNTCHNFAYSHGENGVQGFVGLENDINRGKIDKNWRESPTVKVFVEHFNRVHVR